MLRGVLDGLVAFAFPPRCLLCLALGDPGPMRLCAACRARVPALPRSLCLRCADGLSRGPFRAKKRAPRCAACRRAPPPFRRTVAGAGYEGAVREMILRLKFNGDRELSWPLARLLERALRAAHDRPADRIDAVVPVPLSFRRRFARGFNQAELIARLLARSIGKDCRPSLLCRIRDDPPQSGSPSRVERLDRLRGAFLARMPRSNRGFRILLVDDVMTTGGTAMEASTALRAAGALDVVVAVAARRLAAE